MSTSGPAPDLTRCNLYSELRGSLHRACVHLKGHGGVKGALRRLMRQQGRHRYVARFNVARYYEIRNQIVAPGRVVETLVYDLAIASDHRHA